MDSDGRAHQSHSDDASFALMDWPVLDELNPLPRQTGAPPTLSLPTNTAVASSSAPQKPPPPLLGGPSSSTSSSAPTGAARAPSTAATSEASGVSTQKSPPTQQSGPTSLSLPTTTAAVSASAQQRFTTRPINVEDVTDFLEKHVKPHYVSELNRNNEQLSILPAKYTGLDKRISKLKEFQRWKSASVIQNASLDIIQFVNREYRGAGDLLWRFAPILPPGYHVARALYGPVIVGPELPDVTADIEQRKAVEEREASRIRKQKSRLKKAFLQLERIANRGKKFDEVEVEFWASDVILGKELARNNLVQYQKGWQMTEVADFPQMAPALKEPMKGAVIVRPCGEGPDARVVVSYGCIKHKNPPMVVYKEGFQSTGANVYKLLKGSKLGDNGVYYSLIKYANDEVHWVPSDGVEDLTEKGVPRQSRRPPTYYNPTDAAGKTEDDTEDKVNHGVYVSVKADVNCLNAVYSDSSRDVVEKEEYNGYISEAVQGAVRSKLAQGQGKGGSGKTARKERMAQNISLLARASLVCATINGELPGRLESLSDLVGDNYKQGLASHPVLPLVEDASKLSYEDTILRFTNPNQPLMQQSSKQKAERRKCNHDGCDTPVHSNAYRTGYCRRHDPHSKLCNACNKNKQQKAGGLCIPCYDKQNLQGDKSAPYECILCNQRESRKKDGACSQCREKIGNMKLPCKNCRKETNLRYRKGLCYGCFKASVEE